MFRRRIELVSHIQSKKETETQNKSIRQKQQDNKIETQHRNKYQTKEDKQTSKQSFIRIGLSNHQYMAEKSKRQAGGCNDLCMLNLGHQPSEQHMEDNIKSKSRCQWKNRHPLRSPKNQQTREQPTNKIPATRTLPTSSQN